MIYLYVILIIAFLFFALLFGLYLYTFVRIKPRNLNGAYMQKKLSIKPHLGVVMENIRKMSECKFEEIYITSFDGLRLCANYYETKPGAPVVLFFHGYRSSADRDGSGGFWHLAERGFNIMLVSQRSHGKSEGRTITFGVKERKDCLSWIEYCIKRFGKDVKLVLMGVSMGAATVLLASGMNLPSNVKGIVGDCGYSSSEKIIKSEIKAIHMPVGILYWLTRMSAKIFGGFNLGDADVCDAVSKSKTLILIIHGKKDNFIPYYMAEEIYISCSSEAKLLGVEGAGHAMSFYQNTVLYVKTLDEFLEKALLN